MKPGPKEHFRWSAHTGGLAIARQRDYEAGIEVESASPYALWKELQAGVHAGEPPLTAGDLVEAVDVEAPGSLWIAKYIGFEPAAWFVPEPKPEVRPDGDRAGVNLPGSEEAVSA